MGRSTTKTINKSSSVLADKIKKTETDMKKMMARAGCEEYKTTKMVVPKNRDENDDVVTIGLNGVLFHFQTGKSVNMPDPLVEILTNAGRL